MQELVAIDFETHLISQHMPIPKPVCLSYKYYYTSEEGLLVGFTDMEAFLLFILNKGYTIIAHNMSFEALVIDHWFPNLKGIFQQRLDEKKIVCTKIYEQLLDNCRQKPLYRYDLASLVDSYFKEDISEDKKDPNSWRLRYSELDGVPLVEWPEKAVRYALDDSVWALRVYLEQRKTFIDINLSVKAEYYLNKMGLFGIKTDPHRTDELEQDLINKLTPMYDKLLALSLCEKNKKGKIKKNMSKLREFFKAHIKDIEFTAKGVISTSSESLERYLGTLSAESPAIEVINTFLEIMKYEKILTAFVSRLKNQQVIRTQYNAVVSSGRTSSRSSDNFASVNIQQMPRGVDGVRHDVRNCFVPRLGYKLVSIDYNGLELASTAHQLSMVSSDPAMQRMINSGNEPVDMHSMFAARLKSIKDGRDVSYEEFVAHKKESGYKEFRQLAKPINLGFPGGIGYDNMRSILIRDGVYPKYDVIEIRNVTQYKGLASWYLRNKLLSCSHFQAMCHLTQKKLWAVISYLQHINHHNADMLRVKRMSSTEYAIVLDELVKIKDELFNMYPDLQYFLKGDRSGAGHLNKLTGKSKKVKNEYGEWEEEPMYSFQVADFKRDWCMYTQVCNGFLMQSPAAIGAKKAMCKIIHKYQDDARCNPLAFIHDEIIFEVLDNEDQFAIIRDIANLLISEMQTVLYSVRIAVEAEICGDRWRKEGGEWSRVYWKNPGDAKLYEK